MTPTVTGGNIKEEQILHFTVQPNKKKTENDNVFLCRHFYKLSLSVFIFHAVSQ